jgi:hypothetical protein
VFIAGQSILHLKFKVLFKIEKKIIAQNDRRVTALSNYKIKAPHGGFEIFS